MTIRPITGMWLLLALLALTSPSAAENSAQDSDLTVDPVINLFPITTLGTDSAPAVFTVTNHNAAGTRTLGDVSLSGPNADEFALGNDTCSETTLAANGGHCTVEVIFHPTRRGTKGANLLIPSNDAEPQILTAFVTNHEATVNECCRRMPPVLHSVDIPSVMQAGETYTLTWTQEGYDDSYTSHMVLFDCTGINDGTCGDTYGDATKFAESGVIDPVSVLPGNWQYHGVRTRLFNYSWTFAVPATREDASSWATGGSEIVVRFYRRNTTDEARNCSSMSLLIPGNLSDEYYDTAGRRIVKTIMPGL